jgi:hypothetical protein
MPLSSAFVALRRSALLLAFVLLLPSLGAWGPMGHSSVCYVAWQELPAATRTAVEKIMAANPDIFGTKRGPDALGVGANWPDRIRAAADENNGHDEELAIFSSLNVEYASQADDFHYVNYKADDTQLPNSINAVAAIQTCVTVLASTTATARAKGEALAYLAHCVGDIHQPLHAAYKSDLGGNNITGLKVPRTPLDDKTPKPMKLHSVWDGYFFRAQSSTKPRSYFKTSLEKRMPEYRTKAAAALDPAQWAAESFTSAKKDAYRHPDGSKVKSKDTISPAYVTKGIPIVNERVGMAGVRLAALLKANVR